MNAPAIDVIVVPYDSGRRGWRMGAGPLALRDGALRDRLALLGIDARFVEVELPDTAAGEQGSAHELARSIRNAVRHARSERRFP